MTTLPICCINLLYSLATLSFADSEGNVPLWEAILGRHESMIKTLKENGAEISSGDVGHFACIAVEQNNLELLKNIVQYGGDVTLPKSNGTTALHAAVCEGNTEIVEFLLNQGAGIDKPDINGWTPRALADHQGHEDIKELFQAKQEEAKKPPTVPVLKKNPAPILKKNPAVSFLGKYKSEPTMPPYLHENVPPAREETWSDSRPRRRANNFHDSLIGVKELFQAKQEEAKKPPTVPVLKKNPAPIIKKNPAVSFLGKYKSEPTMPPYLHENVPPAREETWSDSRPRRRANNFHDSLFGVMSAANAGEGDLHLF
jgi:hypothetical protein